MSKNTPERRAARAQRAAEALKAQQAAERKRNLMVGGAVGAVVLVIIGLLYFALNAKDDTGKNAKDEPTIAANGEIAGEIDGFGVVVGDPEAPDTVTIYEDLQCPACASLETQVGEQVAAAIAEGRIRVDYRMVSFLDRASTNDYSSRAMNALLVVLEEAGPDAFLKLHDDLYANQPGEGGAGFEDDELIDRAVQAGAVEADIRPGIEDKVYDQWIKNATDQMSKDGVNATPTIRINGEDADGQKLVELLQK